MNRQDAKVAKVAKKDEYKIFLTLGALGALAV